MVATISPIVYHDFETLVEQVIAVKEVPLFLLLDQLSDVRNFGAIIRTTECTGVDGIIIQKKGAAPVTADKNICRHGLHKGGKRGLGGNFLYRLKNPAAYNRGTKVNQ